MKPTLVLLALLALFNPAQAEPIDVWIGTTTSRGDAEGVYHCPFDEANGQLGHARLVASIREPGFLALHPTLPVLYSTGGEGVAAWRIQAGEDGPVLIDRTQRSTGDAGDAAHLAVDRSGRVLLTAHYGSGKAAAFPLDERGRIGPRASVVQHPAGSRVVPSRQRSPRPHWAGTSPDNRFVFVPDLGCDKVFIYQLNAERAELKAHGSVDTPPGGGPRHMKFSPDGRFAYVLNELSLSLTVMRYDAQAGALEVIQTIPTISDEQKAAESFNTASEVRIHPSGRFVYAANRGHDSISVFAVTPQTGRLSLVEQEPVRGAWPRNFNLSPSGNWLLAAGRDSNTLAVFAVDQSTGALRYDRQITPVPSPICVVVGR